MNTPLVTVLMPNHNGGRFIAATIESVLRQTMTDYEFVIVEDASTDNSLEIINSYDDPRIRVIQLPQNEHICIALNTGLAHAKGKYIARIDSDDCWNPDKLEKQIAYMESHPECGATFTWVNVVDEDDRILSAKESFFVDLFCVENRTRNEWIRHFYFNGSCLCHPSAIFQRKVAEELGGYRNALVQLQDFDFWIRIVRKYEIYILTERLMNYRHCLQGGNVSAMSSSNNVRTYYEMYRVIGRYFDDMCDEQFADVFRGDFSDPNATTVAQLRCERALLLLSPVFCGHAGKLHGMDMLADLLEQEDTRLLLRENYGITQMYFYQLSRSNSLLLENPRDVVYQLQEGALLEGVCSVIYSALPLRKRLQQDLKSIIKWLLRKIPFLKKVLRGKK